jgi:hypothetical protein
VDLTPYVDSLRTDLVAAAEAGGPEVREAAERLALALDPAVRLALLEALSQAADEITSALANGSVDVRLRGREPEFVVDVPGAHVGAQPSGHDLADPIDDDDGTVARITVRLPEAVKARAEDAAARTGQSLNTWIVKAVRRAARDVDSQADAAVALPFGQPPGTGQIGPRRMTGWV